MYSFDDSRRPLYIIRLSGALAAADIATMERDLVAMLEACSAYAAVCDLTEAEFPPRELISAGMKLSTRTSALSRKYYELPPDAPPSYTAYAVRPRLAKLIRFFYKMPALVRAPDALVFPTAADAISAAERQLESFGIALPPRGA